MKFPASRAFHPRPAAAGFLLPAALLGALLPGIASAQQTQSSGQAVVIQQYSGPPANVSPPRDMTIPNPNQWTGGRLPSDIYGRKLEPRLIEPRMPGMFGPETFGSYFLPPIPPVLGEPAARYVAPPGVFVVPTGDEVPPNYQSHSFISTAQPIYYYPQYPPSLADYAGESFYIALGDLGGPAALTQGRQDRLHRYQQDRRNAVAALRAELNRVKSLPSDQRAPALAAFANQQTPQLLSQEAEAEAIREDLTENGLFKDTAVDIGRSRLVAERDSAMHRAQTTVLTVLSAAQFQAGLSAEQRLLLQEISAETAITTRSEAPMADSVIFFWPAGSRLRLPPGLPAEARARVDELLALKSALKQELLAAAREGQFVIFTGDRTSRYAELAQAQAPRFQRLDALAEEIRRDLAAAAARQHLPDELADRVGAVVAKRTALQRELYARLNEYRQAVRGGKVELRRTEGGIVFVASETAGRSLGAGALAALAEQMQDSATYFNAHFAALARERDAVRAAVDEFRHAAPEVSGNLTVDQMTSAFFAAYQARATEESQRDYADAVLTPGLSPAQRRLLFAAACVASVKERLPAAR